MSPAAVSRLIARIPLILVAAFALAGGCDREVAGSTSRPASAEVERLRSLPYLGGQAAGSDEADGVVLHDAERSCPGYNLYEIQMLSRAELIDATGRVVHAWSHVPSERWERAELLPGGDLAVVGVDPHTWTDGGPAGRIADDARYVLRLDRDGRVLWKKRLRAHHDITLTPSGRLAVLTFERRRIPAVHPQIPTRDDQVMLLEADGTVVAARSLLEAARRNPARFPLDHVAPSALGGPPWVDLLHANSVQWLEDARLAARDPLYAAGNLLVCFRHQDRIAVFNWDRHEVLWAWGAGELSGPHDATLLESGNVLVFDNGLGRGASRVLEVEPRSGQIVWRYPVRPGDAFYTESKGAAQRLPNGNTLIAESDRGRAFEVTPDGTIVWEFFTPHRLADGQRAAIVRMRRLPSAAVEALRD